MTGVVKIIKSISAADNAALTEFLQAVDEGQSFRSSSTSPDVVVQHITNLLNKVNTRESGLLLLEAFLKQCSSETLSQKGQLWGTLCIKACYAKSSAALASRAYDCLTILALKSKDVPELSKAFIGQLLPKISETLPSAPHGSHLSALKCIEECLQVFPGPCTPLRNSIEKYVTNFLDSIESPVVAASGRCLHLLQQIKISGNTNVNPKIAWQQYQFRLLGSLHDVLETIYANFPETYDEEIETDRLQISPLELSSEPVQRSTQCLVRFKNLIHYLIVALKEPYPVPKMIAPKKILNLISRGLAINCIMAKKNPISDNLAIGALLPEMHIHLLKLVDVLILTLKSHMALWAKTILRFVTNTLKWTFVGKSDGFPKPYRRLRIAAYNTLRLWCTIMRSGSLCEVVAETIIEQIKSDITPFQSEITLQVLSGARKHMSKKARRQLHKAQNERSNMAQTHSKNSNSANMKKSLSDENNGELCAAALQCFKQIVQFASIFLKPTIIKEVQEIIFGLCAELPNNSCSKDKLYWNKNCRKALYEVVYNLVSHPHHLCPPPGTLAVGLLRVGQFSDSATTVQDTCSELLSALEKTIHPQKECLFFPSNVEEIKNVFKKYNRKRSANHFEESAESSEEEVQLTAQTDVAEENEIDVQMKEVVEESHEDRNSPVAYNNISLSTDEEVEEVSISSEKKESAELNQQLSSKIDEDEDIVEVIDIADDSTQGHDSPSEAQIDSENKEVDNESNKIPEEPAAKKSRLSDEVDLTVKTSNVEDIPLEEAETSEQPAEDVNSSKQIVEVANQPEKPSESAEPDDEMLLESITSAFVDELNEGSNE